jgi:hypothetical protein
MSDIEAQLPVLARSCARVDPQPEHAPRLRARVAVEFFHWLEARCVSRTTTYRLRQGTGAGSGSA